MSIAIVLLNYDVLLTGAHVLVSRQADIGLGCIGALGSRLLVLAAGFVLRLWLHGMPLIMLQIVQLDLPDI